MNNDEKKITFENGATIDLKNDKARIELGFKKEAYDYELERNGIEQLGGATYGVTDRPAFSKEEEETKRPLFSDGRQGFTLPESVKEWSDKHNYQGPPTAEELTKLAKLNQALIDKDMSPIGGGRLGKPIEQHQAQIYMSMLGIKEGTFVTRKKVTNTSLVLLYWILVAFVVAIICMMVPVKEDINAATDAPYSKQLEALD